MGRLSDRVAYGLLIGLLVLTPWPVGSRLPWAGMLASGTVILVATAWIVVGLLDGRRLRWNPAFVPAIAFLAWTGLQWTAGWTVSPHATAFEWVRYLSYFLTFVLAARLVREPSRARGLARVICWLGLVVGAFGLVQFLTWNGHLYWFWDPPYEGTRFGPFNNRNYFAGYMVAALGVPLARLLDQRQRTDPLLGYLTGIAGITVLVSLSRAGMVALAVVVAFLLVALAGREGGHADPPAHPPGARPHASGRSRARARLGLTVLIGVISVLVVLGLLGQVDRVLVRMETVLDFEAETSLRGRAAMWRDAVPMVLERPVTGWGLNTFGEVFPLYRQTPTAKVATHAHNEYLEMVVETGAIGALVCVWFLVVLFGQARSRLWRTADPANRTLRLGALAGWIGILVFSLTDFPTIIPAIDYVLAVLAALASVPTASRDP